VSDENTFNKDGFESDRNVDANGVVGARWWNKALIEADRGASRRSVLTLLAIGGASVVTCSVLANSCEPDEDPYVYARRPSLDLQKEFGWDFGASGEALVFDGTSSAPFDPTTIATLEQDLTPATYLPLHVPTLLQAPNAVPRSRPAEEMVPFEPLASKLRPVHTTAMDSAYACGEAVAKLLKAHEIAAAVLVDLPGAEAVAFAAGAAELLEPVLLLDNWPHPRGVVPCHLALAAALYYQPRFIAARALRPPDSLPLFVLDRARLTLYTDTTTTFDNRYIARLPSPAALKTGAGGRIEWLLYVVERDPPFGPPESEDLVDTFLAYQASGVPVRPVTLEEFRPNTDKSVHFGQGGSAQADVRFMDRFGPGAPNHYKPEVRTAANGVLSARGSTAPDEFGTTRVVLAAGTGAVLGASFDRRGSWNRTGG